MDGGCWYEEAASLRVSERRNESLMDLNIFLFLETRKSYLSVVLFFLKRGSVLTFFQTKSLIICGH